MLTGDLMDRLPEALDLVPPAPRRGVPHRRARLRGRTRREEFVARCRSLGVRWIAQEAGGHRARHAAEPPAGENSSSRWRPAAGRTAPHGGRIDWLGREQAAGRPSGARASASARGRGRARGPPIRRGAAGRRRPAQRRRPVPLLDGRGDRRRPRPPAAPFPWPREFGHDLNIGTVVRTAKPSSPPRCTSSDGAAGTVAVRWSPTGTSTCATTRTSVGCWVRAAERCRYRCGQPPGRRPARDCRAARALRAAVRPGGTRADGGGPRRGRAHRLDRAVRLDPVDQRRVAAGIAMHAWIRQHADLSG